MISLRYDFGVIISIHTENLFPYTKPLFWSRDLLCLREEGRNLTGQILSSFHVAVIKITPKKVIRGETVYLGSQFRLHSIVSGS